uniref:Uncharacterized protein n=1 Tax=Angiostrongylus cantonensis TaxID=6313 RepID=A0A0K0CWT2_ANGCA
MDLYEPLGDQNNIVDAPPISLKQKGTPEAKVVPLEVEPAEDAVFFNVGQNLCYRKIYAFLARLLNCILTVDGFGRIDFAYFTFEVVLVFED